ncbi:g2-like myb family transcription factor [Chlorella sorokiniana]|uniref:G2-like myb family transcription factor n=1 Tax=Chlorella sorokiniana TaxID=3076 RepID=A0A2P6TNN4_CHLSO|nr:g2-like myb family transcription factor [Chlorella sorokiniana]|eukprot:PRW50934.1 g2-like myb family transcription factor [Chlorella sorokiniana]
MSEQAEGSKQKDITRWTPSMEEAYLAALDKVGGLEVAKPRAILDELQHEFPHLTLQACKWHLLAHRRRVERHKLMQPQGIAPPTKWTGRLEAAYEAAVARFGGLAAATPKPVFEALQDDFPELTLQHVKTHMQKQRRKEQRGGGSQASPAAALQRQASSSLDRGQSLEPPQRPSNAAAAAAAFPQLWQAAPEQQPRLVSSSSFQAAPAAPVAMPQEQEEQLSLVQQARLMLQAAGLQVPGSEPLTGEPTEEDLQRTAAVQHAVEALSPHMLSGAQQAQQAQQVQQVQLLSDQQMQQVAAILLAELAPAAGLAAVSQMPPPPPRQPAPRLMPSPVPQAWHAQLLPAAQGAQLVASRQALHCRQCVIQLERQAEQLVELLQALRQSQGTTSSGGGGSGEEATAGTALAAQRAAQQAQQAQQAGPLLEHIPFHLHKLVKRLVTRTSPVSSGKGATTHASSRQQRHAARIASAFTVISGKELHVQGGQQQAQQVQQAQQGQQMEIDSTADQPGPAMPPHPRPGEWKLTHNPATCVIPGCPMCMFEDRLRAVQASEGVPSG